jgi:hypothetical protein
MHEFRTDRKLLAGFDKAAPHLLAVRGPQQETLDVSAGGPLRVEPRREHGRVVAQQDVAGAEELRQVRRSSGGQSGARPDRLPAGATHRDAPRAFCAMRCGGSA